VSKFFLRGQNFVTMNFDPSVKAADLVNYVVLASVYTTMRTNS